MLPPGDREGETAFRLRPLRAAPVRLALCLSLSIAACGGEDSAAAAGSGDDDPPTAEEIRAAAAASTAPDRTRPSPPDEPSIEPSESASPPPPGGARDPGNPPGRADAGRSDAPLPVDPGGPPYAVQLGAFRTEANARTLQESLEAAGFPVWTATTDPMGGADEPGAEISAGGADGSGAAAPAGGANGSDASPSTLLRVRVGATSTVADARRLVELIRRRLPDAPDSTWIAPLSTEGGATDEVIQTTAALLDDG